MSIKQYLWGDLKCNSQRRSFTYLTHKLCVHCKFGLNKINVFFIDMNCLFTSSDRLATWLSSKAVCCSDVTESVKKLFNNLSLLKNVLHIAERNTQFAKQKFTLSHKFYFAEWRSACTKASGNVKNRKKMKVLQNVMREHKIVLTENQQDVDQFFGPYY